MGKSEEITWFDCWGVQGTNLIEVTEPGSVSSQVRAYDLIGAEASVEVGANKQPSTAKVLWLGMLAFSSRLNDRKIFINVALANGLGIVIEGSAEFEKEARVFANKITAVADTTSAPAPVNTPEKTLELLAELGKLRDSGVVTVEEFEAKKKEMLARL